MRPPIPGKWVLLITLALFIIIACNAATSGNSHSFTDDDSSDDSADDDNEGDDTEPHYLDDLALIWGASSKLYVEISNGDGTFTEAETVGSSFGFFDLAAGDFDGNNCLDLVSMSVGYTFSFLTNNCHGVFMIHEEATNFYYFNYTRQTAAVADVDQDGCLDAVFVVGDQNEIEEYQKILVIYYGDCAGGFSNGDEMALSSPPTTIALGNINGDSFPDAAIGFRDGGGIFLGDGNGFYQSASFSEPIWRVTLGDFNNDGDLDMLGAEDTGLYSYLGRGDGTFETPLLLGDSGQACDIGDFNSDGRLDFVSALSNAQTIRVSLNDGLGQFETQDFTLCDWTNSCAVGDFNRDGRLDIAAACQPYESDDDELTQDQQVNILFGNGDGTFQDPIGTGFSASYLIAGNFVEQ